MSVENGVRHGKPSENLRMSPRRTAPATQAVRLRKEPKPLT
ncbi:hypothetical protein NRY95_14240 [Xanthomonas campestris pv. phormiicola]|nr:hypothetical protein NRY95_14240 [Xanthomonas campestris pv. phormiicola]